MLEPEIDDSYGYLGDNAFPFFEEIIIISDHEETSLQGYDDGEFNFLEVKNFSYPADALYHILTKKENRITYSALILCEHTMGDFDAALLISLLRLHPLGTLFPVVVLLDTDTQETDQQLAEIEKANLQALGAFSFLERPFTSQDLMNLAGKALAAHAEEEQKHYKTMQALERADDDAKAHFTQAWKQRLVNFEKSFVRFFYTPAENAGFEEIFLVGKQKYYDRLFHQATTCFERSSVNESPHRADSLIYLYAIQKEQDNPENAKIYLERAVDAYIDEAKWDKAGEYANLFSQEFPDRQNPIYHALQKHFSHANYTVVNNIVESAKTFLPLNDMAGFLLKLNGSKTFPQPITAFIDSNKELKQIIYESNFKETTLDGEEYRRQQERERTLKRLEMQRLARLSGKENNVMPKRQPKNNEKIVLNDPGKLSFDFSDKEQKKNELTETDPVSPADGEEKKSQTKNTSDTASKFGTNSSETVEGLPTVMLDGGNGSFLGDIINMAKFTRNLYKKK